MNVDQHHHDQSDMQTMHWKDKVEEWRAEHATMLSSLRELDEQVREYSAKLEKHLERIFAERISPISHDLLTDTPEGRELADKLRAAHKEYADIQAARSDLDERLVHNHKLVTEGLYRVVKVFQA